VASSYANFVKYGSGLSASQRDREDKLMTIEIRVLQGGDERVLMNVAAEVFDNPIDKELTREFLNDPRHHIAVAVDDELVIGFASGVHYIHPDKPAELWINEVALAPTHRHRGLGKAVLKALLDVGRAHNCKVAWVLTDRNNVAAMALYSSLGGTEGADDVGPADAMIGYSFILADKTKHELPK
jgi:ribosomal protein S18 acetylase RimI-like enzyme